MNEITKSYDNLPWIIRVILQIFFGGFISFFYRLFKLLGGKMNAGELIIWIIFFFFFSIILWWIDLVTVILGKGICFLVK
jgi:hypothetical protein